MDDCDNDDLIQNSDEEWMTESEEPCAPLDKQFFIPNTNSCSNSCYSKLKFLGTGFMLIVSSTFLLISLPLYLETVNAKGDAYTLMLFCSTFTTLVLFVIVFVLKKLCAKNDNFKILKPPVSIGYIVKTGLLLGLSSFLIVYAIDRKRVMCHLQDPIKGIILVFSLVLYFFFCRKLMGLQRIFSCTTIIVGLFISVDYGLCDEFRCRGLERKSREDDAGKWSSNMHALWSTIYVFGLAIYAAHFTMLERCLVPVHANRTMMYTSVSSSFLSTVSRLVSSNDSAPLTNPPTRQNVSSSRSQNASLLIALWLNTFIWLLTIILCWTDMIPGVGKGNNVMEFWNNTIHGLSCHFELPFYGLTLLPSGQHSGTFGECNNTSMFAWPFAIAYIIFSVTSIHFLNISQSGVFTTAVVTVALPIGGIWWSLFQMTDLKHGLLLWSPDVTGELICSLLGLPIVLLGVALLCKAHFKECAELQQLDPDANITENDYSSASTRIA